MSDEALKGRLHSELKNALMKIREGADRRSTFRDLASLSGSIACGGNITRLNDMAADRLVQLYAEGFPENALLDAVFVVAMGHKRGVDEAQQRRFSKHSLELRLETQNEGDGHRRQRSGGIR